MERIEEDATPAEEWEQSLNATCNRLSTQYINLIRAAASLTALEPGRQHDPRCKCSARRPATSLSLSFSLSLSLFLASNSFLNVGTINALFRVTHWSLLYVPCFLNIPMLRLRTEIAGVDTCYHCRIPRHHLWQPMWH